MENQNGSDFFSALSLTRFVALQMAIGAAVQLKVFDIIAKSGPKSQLSAAEIASQIPSANPKAATVAALDRTLRMLAVNDILTTALRPSPPDTRANGASDGEREDSLTPTRVRVYGLTGVSRYLTTDASLSLADTLVIQTQKVMVDCFQLSKDAMLESDTFAESRSNHLFEELAKDKDLSRMFNNTMSVISKVLLDEILVGYRGFKDMEELVDVGGGVGTALSKIVTIHPHIRGINFDLPHVIAGAPDISGVKHVAGDMFKSVPKAKAIMLKFVLHDWDDDRCKKVLRNCWNALPENGKVIVMEYAIPDVLESNADNQSFLLVDFQMMTMNPGGRERTLTEFNALAKDSGFDQTKIFPIKRGMHVLEFLKIN